MRQAATSRSAPRSSGLNPSRPDTIDCAVIGAGVVGLAVGRALALQGRETMVLEAADAIGTETSSRNSEVIHAGIYYPAGSLKARLCVEGRDLLYAYCAEKGVAHRRLGKLIVAVTDAERPVLAGYLAQARANGVQDLVEISAAEATRLEPALRCVAALHSPSTGIIDSHGYLLALQGDLENAGGVVALKARVTRVERREGLFLVHVNDEAAPALAARGLVNAAGLHAQAVARTIGGLPAASIPPRHLARGHYYTLSGKSPFGRLVYPVAEAAGLGIHVTLDLAGTARFGPDVQWIDDIDYRFNPAVREKFAAAIRRYYPDLDEARLRESYTGIRPKLSGPGEPAADFLIQGPASHGVPGLVNLYGIESPGLTASLALAEMVASYNGPRA
jgi:L-2-hydroxyglutarate oxidase LhgO